LKRVLRRSSFAGSNCRFAGAPDPRGSLKRSLRMAFRKLIIPKAFGFEAATRSRTRHDKLGQFACGPAGEAAGIIVHGRDVLLFARGRREILHIGWIVEIFLPADQNSVGAEDISRRICESAHYFGVNVFLMKRVGADLEAMHAEFVESSEPVPRDLLIHSPEGVRLYQIDLAKSLSPGRFEHILQMVPIEKRLAAGDVNFGAVAREDSQRPPRADRGLDGHQPAFVGGAVVITELADAVALVRKQQSRRAPELELGVAAAEATVISIF